MESTIFVLIPIFVTLLTSIMKTVPMVDSITSKGWRSATIRFVVALLSYGGVVGVYMGTGAPIDPLATETFVLATLTFLGSLGVYQMSK